MSMVEINRNPSMQLLRQFAFAWIAFLGLAGWSMYHKTGNLPAACAIWTTGVVIGAAGVAMPSSIRLVYLGLAYATSPIGFVMSHIILGFVYYCVFTPVGLIMKAVGKDSMSRGFDRDAESYWIERPPEPPPEQYFRQF